LSTLDNFIVDVSAGAAVNGLDATSNISSKQIMICVLHVSLAWPSLQHLRAIGKKTTGQYNANGRKRSMEPEMEIGRWRPQDGQVSFETQTPA